MQQKHWLGAIIVLVVGYFVGIKFPNLYKGSLS